MSTSPFDADRGPEVPHRRRKGRGGGREDKGRRGDPHATVPDAQFDSYYGRHVVTPPPWGAAIPVYLFLGGLAAGSGLMAAGGHLIKRPTLKKRGRIASMLAVALGGAALVEDLGRPERALNMMRTMKLTSPMSVGSWILAGFGACTGGALGIELIRDRVDADGLPGRALTLVDPLASAGAAFFAPPLAAYTAVLLSDTAVPLWHTGYRELPFIFVSSATAAGAGLAQVVVPPSETGPVRVLAAVGAACDLVAGHAMGRRLGVEEGRPLHEGRARKLHVAAQVLTAAGGIASLLVGGRRWCAVLSGLSLVAGSACTRFAIFEAGMTSADDPAYTVRPQKGRAAAKRADGRGVTQPGGDWPT